MIDYASLAAALRVSARPPNSSGWGMLAATKSGVFVSQRDPSLRTDIKANVTRVAVDYWLARERPELFKPCDKRDMRVYNAHRGMLERAQQDLGRRMPRTRAPRSSSLLAPRRTTGQPWRLR